MRWTCSSSVRAATAPCAGSCSAAPPTTSSATPAARCWCCRAYPSANNPSANVFAGLGEGFPKRAFARGHFPRGLSRKKGALQWRAPLLLPTRGRPQQRRAYQLMGAGGDAVISTVLPGPDVVAVSTGPSRPQPPNGGRVTSALNSKLPIASSLVGSLIVSGRLIGSTVLQPIGRSKRPIFTAPTSSFALPSALSETSLPDSLKANVPVAGPVGVSAPLTVT